MHIIFLEPWYGVYLSSKNCGVLLLVSLDPITFFNKNQKKKAEEISTFFNLDPISFQTTGPLHHQDPGRYSRGHLISHLRQRYRYPRPGEPP
jgi:hypothetical protein